MTYDDVQYIEGACPKCGEHELRSRYCDVIGCDDGYIDEHDDDPINFAPGEEYSVCQECFGTGRVRWCSKCGHDLSLAEFRETCREDEE